MKVVKYNMDLATNSSTLVSQTATLLGPTYSEFGSLRDFVYSQAVQNYSNLLAKIDFTTNLIIGLATALLVFIGFLTWKNFQLSEQSKKETEKTREFLEKARIDAGQMVGSIRSIADEATKLLEAHRKEVEQIETIVLNVKKNSSEAEAAAKRLLELKDSLDIDIGRFTTISGSVSGPTLSGYSPSASASFGIGYGPSGPISPSLSPSQSASVNLNDFKAKGIFDPIKK